MKRSVVSLMVVGLGLGLVAVPSFAAAEASPIATAMGDLRWGLNEREVSAFAQRELAASYNAEIAKTKDAGKQAKLKADLKRAQSEVGKSQVEFQGGKSRWDSSPVAGEYTYDNGESMLVAKGSGTDSYYFFLNDKLWKVVKVIDKHSAGDFKKFSKSVEDKFGKGRSKKGEVTPSQGNTQWLEYLDRNSRMRAADASDKRGGYAMIFEEMATVRELASTRPQKPTRLAGQSDADEADTKTAKASASAPGSKPAPAPAKEETQIAKAQQAKRSVFANERRDENEGDYQSRKQKQVVEARDRAQKAHERKEDAKKGEALKQLDNINDSDPLGGL
jgi:hypothetical protein